VPRKYYFDFENQSPTVVDIYIKPISESVQFSRDQSESTACNLVQNLCQLCSATFEQLFASGATFFGSSNFKQLFPF
jgi:hypothetical protein